MIYRPLGRSGLSVSAIGLGCVTFAREIDQDQAFAVLDRAMACGINLLDTAEAYSNGASESVLGAWLESRGHRDSVLISTKLSPPLNRDRVFAGVEASLKHLRTDRIDLYQIHSWDLDTSVADTFAAFAELQQQGKVRCIGCSNVTGTQLREVLRVQKEHGFRRLEFIQPIYNLVRREVETELLPLCCQEELGVISYSPLGAGFLTGKYRPDAPLPGGSRFDIKPGHKNVYFSPARFTAVEGLARLAAESGISMVNLALRWAMGRSGLSSVLIGAREQRHVDQALAAAAINLPAAVSSALDALLPPDPCC